MWRNLAFTLGTIALFAQTTKDLPAKPYEDPDAYAVYAALLSSPSSEKSAAEPAVMAQRTFVLENCYDQMSIGELCSARLWRITTKSIKHSGTWLTAESVFLTNLFLPKRCECFF